MVIATVAEFERDLLIDRTQSGLLMVKLKGKPLDRPKALSPAQFKEAKARIANGEAVAAVAKPLTTSRATAMKYLDQSDPQ